MTIGEDQRDIKLKLRRDDIEQVEEFEQLGVIIEDSGRQNREIVKRITKAMNSNFAMSNSVIKKGNIQENKSL